MKIVKPETIIETYTENALQLIEKTGRVCYKSEDKITDTSASKFVKMLIKRGHEAVIEHASMTCRIICDRGITHELVRHRLASFCQESTRYVNYGGGDIQFIEPPYMDEYLRNRWVQACETCEDMYQEMIYNGASPQIARSVLPTCLKSEIVITANFREWRTIMKLRLASGAHPQIKEVIIPVYNWFKNTYPEIVDDINVEL